MGDAAVFLSSQRSYSAPLSPSPPEAPFLFRQCGRHVRDRDLTKTVCHLPVSLSTDLTARTVPRALALLSEPLVGRTALPCTSSVAGQCLHCSQ